MAPVFAGVAGVVTALGGLGTVGALAAGIYGVSQLGSALSGGGGMQGFGGMQQQDPFVNANSVLDDIPDIPPVPDTSAADSAVVNAEAEAARQQALQEAAAAEQANAFNPTGGLGDTSTPRTRRSQLIGG